MAEPKISGYAQMYIQFTNNLDVLCAMKSQLLHSGLFLVATVMTLAFYAREDIGYKLENNVFLTNFRKLPVDDYLSANKSVINTKDDLINKWLCPQAPTQSTASLTVQPLFKESWGPDNVCTCFRAKNCTTTTECVALETSCYKNAVPQYANVYAGSETPFFSILAAFLLIHISVLLNMTIEVMDDGRADAPKAGTDEEQQPLQAIVEQEPSQALVHSTKPELVTLDDMRAGSRFRYLAVGGGGEVVLHVGKSTYSEKWPASYMRTLSAALRNLIARFAVLTLLSLGVVVVTLVAYNKKTSQRGPNQKCDDTTMCLTEIALFVLLLLVSVIATCWFCFSMMHVIMYTSSVGLPSIVTSGLRMMEEVTLTAACMSLVASFTALSGVHDDTTILFDVVVVLFIGFMQSVQHRVMLLRETVITHCAKSTIMLCDGLGKTHTLSSEVLAYFLHTRLFIFVVIVTSTYVFFERMQPTLAPMDSANTWNSYMRNVALLVSLIPNLMCDISYEFFHMREMRASGEHMSYTGAAMWRRTVYLAYIILYVFASLQTTPYADRPFAAP